MYLLAHVRGFDALFVLRLMSNGESLSLGLLVQTRHLNDKLYHHMYSLTFYR